MFEAPEDLYGFEFVWVGIVGRINLLAKLCQEINWLCKYKQDVRIRLIKKEGPMKPTILSVGLKTKLPTVIV
jgi:hypothetical protein